MRVRTTVLAVLVVLLFVFQVAAEEVTVLWGDVLTRGIWTEYAARFEEETGIKVNTINVSYDQRFDKVVTSAMSGVGTFDVIQLDAIWTPQFAAAGWLWDITDHLDPEVLAELNPAAVDAVSYQGRIYGLPFFNSSNCSTTTKRCCKMQALTVLPNS